MKLDMEREWRFDYGDRVSYLRSAVLTLGSYEVEDLKQICKDYISRHDDVSETEAALAAFLVERL